jgi:ribosomal-protein-alanine N-acetyltransferase
MRFPFSRDSEVLLEIAKDNQAEVISDLHARCFERQWGTAEIARLLADDAVSCITVRAVGKPQSVPLAFVLFRNIIDEAEILSIGVDHSHRKKGMARQLMEETIRKLQGDRARALFLEVDSMNVPAVKLYRNLKFKTISERPAYYKNAAGEKSAALVMRLDLV